LEGVAVVLIGATARLTAQGAGLQAELARDLTTNRDMMTKIADAMPVANLGFKATPAQRSYGEQILHRDLIPSGSVDWETWALTVAIFALALGLVITYCEWRHWGARLGFRRRASAAIGPARLHGRPPVEGCSAAGTVARSIGRGLAGKALATMAGLIGALMLSRAVDDPKLSDQILKAAAAVFRRP
jgi:hypothetical protein